jgi:hypothetical protein
MAKFTLELKNDSCRDFSLRGLIFSIFEDPTKVVENPALEV